MKGFEILINEKSIPVGNQEGGMLSVLIDARQLVLSIFGSDHQAYTFLRWDDQKLQEGNTIKIRFSDIESSTPPAKISEKSLDELLEIYKARKEQYIKMGWL